MKSIRNSAIKFLFIPNPAYEIDQIEAYNEKHHTPRLTLPEGQESPI